MRIALLFILVFAAIGAVSQNAPPELKPGNRAEQQEGTHKNEDAANSPQSPSPPPSAPTANGVNDPTAVAKTKEPEHKSQYIWEEAFGPETWPHWALFFAAIWAGRIALKTLKAIEREAEEAKIIAEAAKSNAAAAQNAAEAASKSTDAFINSERAWIMADIVWTADTAGMASPTTMRVVLIGKGDHFNISVGLVCKNDGRTPAWIIRRSVWLGFFQDLPNIPDTSQYPVFTTSHLQPLSVGQSTVQQLELECEGSYPQLGDSRTLVIYGVVKYRDAFGHHETWFGYTIHGAPADPRLDRLAGFDEYNKNT